MHEKFSGQKILHWNLHRWVDQCRIGRAKSLDCFRKVTFWEYSFWWEIQREKLCFSGNISSGILYTQSTCMQCLSWQMTDVCYCLFGNYIFLHRVSSYLLQGVPFSPGLCVEVYLWSIMWHLYLLFLYIIKSDAHTISYKNNSQQP